jgi:hypothetical protein
VGEPHVLELHAPLDDVRRVRGRVLHDARRVSRTPNTCSAEAIAFCRMLYFSLMSMIGLNI